MALVLEQLVHPVRPLPQQVLVVVMVALVALVVVVVVVVPVVLPVPLVRVAVVQQPFA